MLSVRHIKTHGKKHVNFNLFTCNVTVNHAISATVKAWYCANGDGHFDGLNGLHIKSARQSSRQSARHHWHNVKLWRWQAQRRARQRYV